MRSGATVSRQPGGGSLIFPQRKELQLVPCGWDGGFFEATETTEIQRRDGMKVRMLWQRLRSDPRRDHGRGNIIRLFGDVRRPLFTRGPSYTPPPPIFTAPPVPNPTFSHPPPIPVTLLTTFTPSPLSPYTLFSPSTPLLFSSPLPYFLSPSSFRSHSLALSMDHAQVTYV